MKLFFTGLIAGIVVGALFLTLPAARATEGEDRYRISQSGAGAFVVLDAQSGEWEHLSTRPNAQGLLTVMRGRVGGTQVEQEEIRLAR
jgi:hypothetical protein